MLSDSVQRQKVAGVWGPEAGGRENGETQVGTEFLPLQDENVL